LAVFLKNSTLHATQYTQRYNITNHKTHSVYNVAKQEYLNPVNEYGTQNVPKQNFQIGPKSSYWAKTPRFTVRSITIKLYECL